MTYFFSLIKTKISSFSCFDDLFEVNKEKKRMNQYGIKVYFVVFLVYLEFHKYLEGKHQFDKIFHVLFVQLHQKIHTITNKVIIAITITEFFKNN